MNKLPPAAAGLLEQARETDRVQNLDFEPTLARLHAALPFADVGAGGPAGESGVPNLPPAGAPGLGHGLGARALLATKTAKLVLVGVALGGALGGAFMLLSPSDRLPPAAHEEPAATIGAAGTEGSAATASAPTRAGTETQATPSPQATPSAQPERSESPTDARAPTTSASAAASARSSQEDMPRLSTTAAADLATGAADARAHKTSRKAEVAAHQDDLTERQEEAAPARSAASESELDLIDGAFAELRKGEPAHALGLLDRHRSLFPAGTFATERQGLHVLALCAAGRVDEGRREQAAFLRNAPNSPIAARVRNACPSTERP